VLPSSTDFLCGYSHFTPSSKICSNCGNKKPELKLSQRVFHCENCDFEIVRDLNAAINLEQEGIRPLA